MTRYSGGKQKIGQRIAEKIYNESIKISQNEECKIDGYVEAFCGMMGVFQHIPELFNKNDEIKYKANDINESVVEMWKSLQNGWVPPTSISET